MTTRLFSVSLRETAPKLTALLRASLSVVEGDHGVRGVVARRVVSRPKGKVLLSRSRLGNEHG